MSKSEVIDRWFCACSSYPDDPGMVVCWRCEQPLVECGDDTIDASMTHNLLALGIRYRRALEAIGTGARRPELANAEYLSGIAIGALGDSDASGQALEGRCGRCDRVTDTLPCQYCAAALSESGESA